MMAGRARRFHACRVFQCRGWDSTWSESGAQGRPQREIQTGHSDQVRPINRGQAGIERSPPVQPSTRAFLDGKAIDTGEERRRCSMGLDPRRAGRYAASQRSQAARHPSVLARRTGDCHSIAAPPALSPIEREATMHRVLPFVATFLAITSATPGLCFAQAGDIPAGAPRAPDPVVFTTAQDRQNMLDQLGITRLRPGRDSNANAANPANYDQAKANPFPKLPEVLGTNVTTAEQWWRERRPEVVELLEREVYGRIPGNAPKVRWEVRETREVEAGGKPAVRRHIVGVVDNSACPEIKVNISLSLTLPKKADGPVPVLMSFGPTPFDPSPFAPRAQNGGPRPPSKEDVLIAAGWGCAMLNPSTVQDDSGGWQPRRGADPDAKPTGAGLTRGIIGLTNLGQPRKPDQWGALRAWGWGASRGLDYLETVPEVNAKRVGIAGVSRYGKAALVTMAF